MDDYFSRKQLIRNELPKALLQHQFELYYQPQFETNKNKLIGIEALIRWNHPEYGFIPPGEFISIAEETGIINEIGHWVLETACKDLKMLQEDGNPELRVAVNLSVRQFEQKKLFESIKNVLDFTRLEAQYLELEITENLSGEKYQGFLATLNKLKDLGVKIALDDFGTGYSSLSYLQTYPIHLLKLDRSFIEKIEVCPKQEMIVKAVISLAHALGMDVLAEGVETESQMKTLQTMGCDYTQGYLLGRPQPLNELKALFQQAIT
ncbi:MAG: EAL domain-containing protein [Bacillus sp. (in: Bacteria)]|nr:EAL domain-containing protein [Bacillus sp. (in: firmicutes)]